jgi:multidrug transporter EmrE-like cation transporter
MSRAAEAAGAAPAHAIRSARIRGWMSLAVAIALLNTGNIALDMAVKERPLDLQLFLTPAFPLAIGCLGAAFFCYVRALSVLPLGVAYPVMVGVSLVVVAIASFIWLNVPLNALQLAGILAVFAGVTLVSRASRQSEKGC